MGPREREAEKRIVAYRLKFSSRAVREVGEAYEWYEAQSQGLGSEYEAALELQLRRLEQAPLLYTEILPGIRRTLLPRFPYGVFYAVRVIWCASLPSFTMCAIPSAGQAGRHVNLSFHRTQCTDEF